MTNSIPESVIRKEAEIWAQERDEEDDTLLDVSFKEVERLRQAGEKPRVHGNGFIQFDLSDIYRLHIWGDPRIPRQRVETPIHDHVFQFTSYVIRGRLLNVRYAVIPAERGDFKIYQAEGRYGHDTKLVATEVNVYTIGQTVELIQESTRNQAYFMPACEFHETIATSPAASVILKRSSFHGKNGAKPRVLVPHGKEPDNEFDRYTAASEETLMNIIYDVLERKV